MDNGSIDNLARMVKEGFDQTATKEDVSAIRGDISDIRGDISDIREDISHIDERLDRIEKLILKNHEERIRRIEDALGLPLRKTA